MHARHIRVVGIRRVKGTDDYVEAQVVRRRTFIQAHLKILRRVVVIKQHRAPFNIEDTVRRTARNRGEDTAVSTGETRAAAQAKIRSHILPYAEDGEVIRALIRRRRQTGCDIADRFVCTHEVNAPIGANVHAVIGLIV